MFDVLWGRWPRWSELYNIYSYIPESRVGQTANVHRFGPGWSLNPHGVYDSHIPESFSVVHFTAATAKKTSG